MAGKAEFRPPLQDRIPGSYAAIPEACSHSEAKAPASDSSRLRRASLPGGGPSRPAALIAAPDHSQQTPLRVSQRALGSLHLVYARNPFEGAAGQDWAYPPSQSQERLSGVL